MRKSLLKAISLFLSLVVVATLFCSTIVSVAAGGREVTYYVKRNGAGKKDGSSLADAAESVYAAVSLINAAGYTSNDTVTIKVSGGESIENDIVNPSALSIYYTWPWPSASSAAQVIITSVDPKNPAMLLYGEGGYISAFSDTTFKDINLLDGDGGSLNLYSAGFDLSFENVKFYFADIDENLSRAQIYSQTRSYPLDIYVGGTTTNVSSSGGVVTVEGDNVAYPYKTVSFGGINSTSATISSDATAVINGGKIWRTYLQRTAFATVYKGNVNMILNGATVQELVLSENGNYSPIIEGAIQILANNGSSLPSVSGIIEYADKNDVPCYIIDSSSYDGELQLGNKAGQFAVKSSKVYAFAYNAKKLYYGTDVLKIKESGSYKVGYADSIDEIISLAAGNWTDNGDGTMDVAYRKGTYYVQYGGTGDGLSPEAPVATVDDAIKAANAAGYSTNDIVCINVIQSSDWNYGAGVIGAGKDYRADAHHITTWSERGTMTSHKFTALVQGEGAYLASSSKLGFNTDMVLGGPTVFENIVIVRMRRWRGLYANGYDVTYGDGAVFATVNVDDCDSSFNTWDGNIQTSDENSTVSLGNVNKLSDGKGGTLEFKNNPTLATVVISSIADIWVNGSATGPTAEVEKYSKDVSLNFDNPDFNANIRWGNQNGGASLFEKNLNINIKNAKSIGYISGNGAVTVNGGIQIISSVAATGVTAIPDNVTTVSGKWFIQNNSYSDLLDFTDETGVFAVKYGCSAVAVNSKTGESFISKGGKLTLDAGEYTVSEINEDDGVTDIIDLIRLKKFLGGLSESVGRLADYNYDGRYDSRDVSALIRQLLTGELIVGGSLMNTEPLTGGADAAATQLKNEIMAHSDTISSSRMTYYVSESGSDSNWGILQNYPIKTISKVNSLSLKSGDVVLFKRGDIFRTSEAIELVSGVSYGTYGSGEKPKIYGSLRNYADKTIWISENNSLWSTSLNAAEAGNIVFDEGKAMGVRKDSLSQVKANGDYYFDKDNKLVYLYLREKNPGEYFDSIEISSTEMIFDGYKVGNNKIENLTIKYVAEYAISVRHSTGACNVSGCEIGYVGGGYMNDDDRTTRLGNAIEFWCTGYDSVVSNNHIYQIYDAALTFQGNGNNVYRNLTFTRNLVEYCSMNFEFWAEESEDDKGVIQKAEISNIKFTDNILRFSGMGFGGRRATKTGQAFVLAWHYAYDDGQINGFDITGNTFDCADTYFFYGINALKHINISDNSYYQKIGCDLAFEKGKYNVVTDQQSFENAVASIDSNALLVKWLED